MSLSAPPLRIGALERVRAAVAAHPDALALGLVVLVASLVRLAFAFRTPVFLLRDSASYYLPAWDLVHGLGFELSVRRTPVYPLFLSGTIALLGEELLAVAFAQHLLGVATAALAYLLGRLTFGRLAGLLAGLLTGLNGALLISEHYVMPEALLVALLLLTFSAAIVAIRKTRTPRPTPSGSSVTLGAAKDLPDQTRGDGRSLHFVQGRLFAAPRVTREDRIGAGLFLLTGVVLGLAILCKPVAQVFVPLIPAVALLSFGAWRRVVRPTATFALGLVLVLLPWVARNWVVHGSATTAGALGQTLVARTAKHDRGFDWYDARQADRYERREGIARQIVENGIRQRLSDGEIYRRVQDRFGMTDAEINAFMRDLSTRVILAQPVYYAQGTLQMTGQLLFGEAEKLSTDWKTQNARLSRDEWEERVEHLLSRATPAQRNELERAEDVVAIFQPAYLGPILPLLALLGMVAAVLRPALHPALLLGLATLALLGISAALDGPVVRYRYPADPLIAIAAAGGLIWTVGLVRSGVRRWRVGRVRFGRPLISPAGRAGLAAESPSGQSPLAPAGRAAEST